MGHVEIDAETRMPFLDEPKVTEDPALTHDDITLVQTRSHAAARVSAEHLVGMLYSATPAYAYDPHNSPGGVHSYPSLGETPAEQR